MKLETIKSFILAVLVGISFLLSYILWSYQPNYELFYDASYINEVDVGGSERTKSDLIKPEKMIFHFEQSVQGFLLPTEQNELYKEMTSWDLDEYTISDAAGKPENVRYIEIIYPNLVSASLLPNLFTFQEEVPLPEWSFDRMYVILDEETQTVKLNIISYDEQKQIEATFEKTGAYQELAQYNEDHPLLEEYMVAYFDRRPVYVPENARTLQKKTLVAGNIHAELFINVLFSNPSLVKSNLRDGYFTDGQRGMRLYHDGRYLEYINPIDTNVQRMTTNELIDKSIEHINEHKGWLNDFFLEMVNASLGKIQFRLEHDGYPVYDINSFTLIEQEWREFELYQYRRPLLFAGNMLNIRDVKLPSGKAVLEFLEQSNVYALEKIKNIQIGYMLNYSLEEHSLTLDPTWLIHYEGNWLPLDTAAVNVGGNDDAMGTN